MAKTTKPPFNKGDLIELVAAAVEMPKTKAKIAVETLLEGIKKNTKREVRIAGFGTFCVQKRKARNGFNPRTGEKIKIKASKTVKFRPGQAYKDML
jgi:DNA-binding protein HU-beta